LPHALKDVTILELQVFADVARLGSIRAAARHRSLQPSHVSKVVARLEDKLSLPLFKRSALGIVLTREGHSVLGHVDDALDRLGALASAQGSEATRPVVTIGAVSYIASELVAPALGSLGGSDAGARFRLLEVGPDALVESALQGGIDAAVHAGDLPWTSTWVTRPLGTVAWGLFAAADHPLLDGQGPASPEDVCKYPFVVPTYWQAGRFVVGNDHCPVSWGERAKGHEAATASGALHVATHTLQLAYVPVLAARGLESEGRVRRVHVDGWPVVTRPLHLAVNVDRISKPLMESVATALSRSLGTGA
jgi:LysR family transcriptional regulator for bpeEF and oprC